MARARTIALALAGWTVFVWTTRIVNVLGDDDLGAWGIGSGLVTAALLLALAGRLAWVALRRPARLAVAVGGVAAWTVIVWLVGVPGIVLGGYGAAFVVVHLGLAVLSVALSVLAVEAASTASRDSGRAVADR